MNASQFRGTTVALITPFTTSNEIDEQALKNLVDWHIEEGTDVILACGTTGESATLSHEEHHRVIELVIEYVNGRVPVLCGAGSNSTAEAISLTKHAQEAGGDGVLLVGPYYNKPTQEGYYQHFKAVAAETKLPVVLYNVPGRTGSNICAETTLRLAEIENIVAIKEASGNMSQIMNILQNRPKEFLVLSGDDSITLPMLSMGGDGVISVIANETPKLLHDMVHSAFANDWDTARKIHFQLLDLMEKNFIESNPIPVKAALGMMGKINPSVRLPLIDITDSGKKVIEGCLKDLNLI